MSDARRRPAMHRSIFVRLVAIMLVMALCLMGLVVGFFTLVVDPAVGGSVERMIGDYARRLAADRPSLSAARSLASRLGVQIRYEGPNGVWTTDDSLPRIDEVGDPASWGHDRYLVENADGGRYLFVWEFGRRAQAAHDRLLLMLLTLMIVVFVAAHRVLRHALQPLSALQQGVARLSAGDLDVVLENRTRDEFGALTDAFNRMAARIRERVKARDQLLQDVSHELRSPLTRLKVALALLPDSRKKAQAEADVADMETLVSQLLEFERLRDGPGLARTRVDLLGLLHDSARPWLDVPPGVRVSAACPAIQMECDAGGVRTIVRNLLENAVKYALPDSRPVEVDAAVEDGDAVVRVSDDGPGIPAADLERLFEPFFRVDRSRSRRTGGYGLGLSLCKRIAEAHGGRLEARNNPGRGVCFTLVLPLRPTLAESAAPA